MTCDIPTETGRRYWHTATIARVPAARAEKRSQNEAKVRSRTGCCASKTIRESPVFRGKCGVSSGLGTPGHAPGKITERSHRLAYGDLAGPMPDWQMPPGRTGNPARSPQVAGSPHSRDWLANELPARWCEPHWQALRVFPKGICGRPPGATGALFYGRKNHQFP